MGDGLKRVAKQLGGLTVRSGNTTAHFNSKGKLVSQKLVSIQCIPSIIRTIISGDRTTLIKLGRRNISTGILIIEPAPVSRETEDNTTPPVVVNVTRLSVKPISDVTDEEAQAEGVSSATDLAFELMRLKPTLIASDEVTIFEFSLVRVLDVSKGASSVGITPSE